MSKKSILVSICLMVCLVLVLAACGGGAATPTPAPPAPTPEGTAPEATPDDEEDEPQGWQPSGTITLICPFNAGSVGDIFSRPFAEIMSRHAGVPVIVENMGGGSGAVGTVAMLSAAADGYTFSYHSNTGALTTAAGTAPFGVYDVLPFVNIGSDFHTMSVLGTDDRFQSVEDIVAFAHANPGQLRLGGAQVMGNNHLFALLFMRDFEIDAVYIPYDDGASSILGLLGGSIDVLFTTNSAVWPHIESGDIRAMAHTLPEPFPALDERDVPTFAALGSTGLANYTSFKGMFLNPNVPDYVAEWYDRIGYLVFHDPDWLAFLEQQQHELTYMNMADFTAYYRAYVAMATLLFEEALP